MEKSAGIVVFHGDKFLLLHYASGHWDFAKGHIENGESEHVAALRELKEETGIVNVDIIDGFSERIKYFFKRDGKSIAKEVVFFVGESGSDKVVLSDEHVGFVWLPFKDALEKLTFDSAKGVLKKVFAFLKDV